jgi:ferredoxin-2, mitochondrial
MKLHFIAADGAVIDAEGRPRERLLDAAQRAGQPLEGTCDGDMACATCHVIVAAADFARLPAASADEEDMLDLAYGATRTSRLACQIALTDALDGLTVRIP